MTRTLPFALNAAKVVLFHVYHAIIKIDTEDLFAMQSGALTIVDLTDPLLSKSEANSIFQVEKVVLFLFLIRFSGCD